MPESKGAWQWAGELPPKVIEEAKAELSLEQAVADALMGNGDYGPEVEARAREKMNLAIQGRDAGAARDYIVSVLQGLQTSGWTGMKPPVARDPGSAGAG